MDGSLCYNTTANARWSSLVARRAHNPQVAGSNPARATNEHTCFGRRLCISGARFSCTEVEHTGWAAAHSSDGIRRWPTRALQTEDRS